MEERGKNKSEIKILEQVRNKKRKIKTNKRKEKTKKKRKSRRKRRKTGKEKVEQKWKETKWQT